MKRAEWVRFAAALALVLILAGLAVGCGDDETTPKTITLADFEGVWRGSSLQATAKSDPNTKMDLVVMGGEIGFEEDASGAFQGWVHIPAIPPLLAAAVTAPMTGHVVLASQDSLRLVFDQEIPPFFESETVAFDLDGSLLVFHRDNDTFDFGAGEEPSEFMGRFTRVPSATLADFEGDWDAVMYLITSDSNPAHVVELIAVGGSLAFVAAADGSFTGHAFIPAVLAGEDTPLDFAGDFALESPTHFTATFDEEYPPFLTDFDASLQMFGPMAAFTTEDVFDFGEGEEAVTVVVVVVK